MFVEGNNEQECMGLMNPENYDSMNSWLIRMVHRYSSMNYLKLKELGIHPGQLPVLILLSKKGGLSLREMADFLHIKPPTVTVTIQRLEKAGIVCKVPDEKDLRINRIFLTEKGKNLDKHLQEIVQKNEEILTAGFSPEELDRLKGYFLRMMDNLSGGTERKK